MPNNNSGKEKEVTEEYLDKGEAIAEPLKKQIKKLKSLIEEVSEDERIPKEKRIKLASGMANGCINILAMELGNNERQFRRARGAIIEILTGEGRNPAYG